MSLFLWNLIEYRSTIPMFCCSERFNLSVNVQILNCTCGASYYNGGYNMIYSYHHKHKIAANNNKS